MYRLSYLFNLYKLFFTFSNKYFTQIFFIIFIGINIILMLNLILNLGIFSILYLNYSLLFYILISFYLVYIYQKLNSIIIDYINNEISQLLLINCNQLIILYSFIILCFFI